ncbi:MAG TPA: hypothetical protein DCX07_15765, partial [Phycisphaerales bacterium]|nr:hypothetical protein [Phycisphaerales bacterium]
MPVDTPNMKGWSGSELLGAAEAMYYAASEDPARRDSFRKKMLDILDVLSQTKLEGNEAKRYAARALVLRILISQNDRVATGTLADKLIEVDPKNAVPWMLKAENAWAEGKVSLFIEYCKKVGECSAVTLYDSAVRKRMLDALKRCNMDQKESLSAMLNLPDPEPMMFIRHAALLYFFPRIESMTKSASAVTIGDRLSCRRYLSLLGSDRPVGQGIAELITHFHFIGDAPFVLNQRIQLEGAIGQQKVLTELDMLNLARPTAIKEMETLDRLAKDGTLEEMRAFCEWVRGESDRDPFGLANGITREN